jgi:hypothetical protein
MENPVNDCGVPWEKVPAEVEAAYRRGFHQGVAIALAALANGATIRDLRGWEHRLSVWRYSERFRKPWQAGELVAPVWPPQIVLRDREAAERA